MLKGEVEMLIGEDRHHLYPGDYTRVPADCVHAFTGLSEEEGLVIAFESPSHSHLFFEEIHRTIRNFPEDLDQMPAIGQRHQVTFIK